jgi:hypothetical protein
MDLLAVDRCWRVLAAVSAVGDVGWLVLLINRAVKEADFFDTRQKRVLTWPTALLTVALATWYSQRVPLPAHTAVIQRRIDTDCVGREEHGV